MSAEMMIAAMEIVETDDRLSTLEKLVLIRFAWKSRPGRDYEIRFATMARELNASRNGIKKAVNNLIAYGYLYSVSVKVRPGPRLQSLDWSPSDHATIRHTGHPVTSPPSPSDQKTGHPVTSYQTKNKNYGALSPNNPLRKNLETAAARRNVESKVRNLSAYQKSAIRDGKPVLLDGGYLTGSDLDEVRAILRKIEGV